MRKVEKELLLKEQRKKAPVKTEHYTCDDFEMEGADGETYHPHLDEWIEVLPIRRLSELRNVMEMATFASQEGTTDLVLSDPRVMNQYSRLTRYLSDVIFNWNFTDEDGNVLPRPYRQPEVIENLSFDEINYLTSKLIGGRTDESKND